MVNFVSILSHQPTVLNLLVLCCVSITQQVAVSERLHRAGLVPTTQLCIIEAALLASVRSDCEIQSCVLRAATAES